MDLDPAMPFSEADPAGDAATRAERGRRSLELIASGAAIDLDAMMRKARPDTAEALDDEPASAPPTPEDHEPELMRLAALDAAAYELARDFAARGLKLGKTVLDEEVRKRRNISELDLPAACARLATLRVDLYQRERKGVARWFGISPVTLDAEVTKLRLIGANAEARASGRRDEVAELIEEFNAKFMVVSESGKAIIYAPSHDPVLKRDRFDRLAFGDFRGLYLNRLVCVGVDENGQPVSDTAAEIWLRHPRRRQFIGGVTFDPASRTSDPTVLNLWKGFAVEALPGDWSLLKDHIRATICSGDDIRFNYLYRWMARLLQHPDEQGEVAVVMRGGEGTGKGTVARALLRILGQHGLAVSNSRHLTSNFNGHLRDVVLLFADEAFFAGDKAHVGVLKSLITEPHLTVEAKYANAVQTANYLHVMMASNEEWVVPASVDARRFFVLEVDGANANNHDYFGAIWKQMDAGGYEAMLHELLAVDLTGFNVRDVPQTDALQHQRKLSLPTPELWWHDCLQREFVFRSKLGLESEFRDWMEELSTELLFASYLEFIGHRHDWHPLSRETFGRFLLKMGCKGKRLLKAVVGERFADVTDAFGNTRRKAEVVRSERPPGYSVGTLEAARAGFEDATGLKVDWADPDAVARTDEGVPDAMPEF